MFYWLWRVCLFFCFLSSMVKSIRIENHEIFLGFTCQTYWRSGSSIGIDEATHNVRRVSRQHSWPLFHSHERKKKIKNIKQCYISPFNFVQLNQFQIYNLCLAYLLKCSICSIIHVSLDVNPCFRLVNCQWVVSLLKKEPFLLTFHSVSIDSRILFTINVNQRKKNIHNTCPKIILNSIFFGLQQTHIPTNQPTNQPKKTRQTKSLLESLFLCTVWHILISIFVFANKHKMNRYLIIQTKSSCVNLNLIKNYCRKKMNHRHSNNFDGMFSRGRYFTDSFFPLWLSLLSLLSQ